MRLATAILVAALTGLSPAALAHAPKVGANGGAQADAGSFHVELVARRSTVEVYLRDHNDKAVAVAGFKGAAILVVDGKPHRIVLVPDGGNRLTGTAPVELPGQPKGAVMITTPTGSTAQAKFQ